MTDPTADNFRAPIDLSTPTISGLTPRAYRLARRDGQLILQGEFLSWAGQEPYHFWEDIPIVHLAPKAGPFSAKTTPDLTATAQQLVAAYDATPGSSGPYCCPGGLAAALALAADIVRLAGDPAAGLHSLSAQLRGQSE